MEIARSPENEMQRLACLYDYDILDTEEESIFDEVAEIAASICNTPIALISLIDESRQWFKSHIGIDARETSRDFAFCAHAILNSGLLIVPDTLKDERFADNPLVTGEPHIRFYAGAPLYTDEGYGLGTLCIIDREPRELSDEQQKALLVLRTHVMKLLEVRRLTRELEKSYHELETFSYTLSHDLRIPLRAVTGFTELLLNDHKGKLDNEVENIIHKIHDSSLQMHHLTTDLIDLARLSRQPLELREVDLYPLVQQVVAELDNNDTEQQIALNIQPEVRVLADPGLLRIALTNLLDNAKKYTSRTDNPVIEFGMTQQGITTVFFVKDNGIGFEMADADKLFEPFLRLHSSEDYPGTGIGLATTRRIIERHHGRIWAESATNIGTTIFFTLQGQAVH